MRVYVLIAFAALALSSGAAPAHAKGSPFHTHAQINARLKTLARVHSGWISLHSLGTTQGAREILAIEFDADGKLGDDDPVFLVHGGMHGNEWGSVEVALHMAELIVALGPERLGGLRLHLVPVVNPDGFDLELRKVKDGQGPPYDPNREFPVPGEPNRSSRPLVQALRDYAERGALVGVLDYHNPAESVTWPYAHDEGHAPEDVKALSALAEDMARSVGYDYGQTARVIGYKHAGTAQDYFASHFGVPALLMELGWLRGPEVDDLRQEVIEQERPFLLYLDWLTARQAR